MDVHVLVVLLHPDLSETQGHVVCADIFKPMLLYWSKGIGSLPWQDANSLYAVPGLHPAGPQDVNEVWCRFLQKIGTYLPVYMTFQKAARHC